MAQNLTSDILIRIGKFDDYKGPICLNAKINEECQFCDNVCNGLSSKVIIDALSLDKTNLFFEEQDANYQATNILAPNPQVRGSFDKYSIIFKIKKEIGRIRTDLLMRIRADFTEKLVTKAAEEGDLEFANRFCTHWEDHLKKLKYVTEFEEERLRTEEALKNANEIMAASNIILKVDINGNLTFLNPFAEKFYGYALDEILGKNIGGTLVPGVNTEGVSYSERLELFKNNPDEYEFVELETTLKDGTTKWVALTNKPIYNKEGKMVEILSVGMDITPLKRTEQKLAREKALAQSYFDMAGVMLLVLDDRLKITRINKKGLQLLGFEDKNEESVIGQDWCEHYIPQKDKALIRGELLEVRNGKNEFNKNYILNTKGDKILIFWHNSPIFDEKGHFNGILSSGEDITGQKEAEKQLIKEKAVKTLKDQMF